MTNEIILKKQQKFIRELLFFSQNSTNKEGISNIFDDFFLRKFAMKKIGVDFLALFPVGKKMFFWVLFSLFEVRADKIFAFLKKKNDIKSITALISLQLKIRFLLYKKYNYFFQKYFTHQFISLSMIRYVKFACDNMWKNMNDNSVDENYFSKRMILGIIYSNLIKKYIIQGHENIDELIKKEMDIISILGKSKKLKDKFNYEKFASFLGKTRYSNK